MHSCLYQGFVRHRRFQPSPHAFRYPITYALVDLDEWDVLCQQMPFLTDRRWGIASLCRHDHFHVRHASESLRTSVTEYLSLHRPDVSSVGPIRLLTLWRSWGQYFSPVNFFFCYARGGKSPFAVIAEVSNTPWRERHLYLLEPHTTDGIQESQLAESSKGSRDGDTKSFHNTKVFHVSPFLDIGLNYKWQWTFPDETLAVHLEVRDDTTCWLDTTLTLQRHEWTRAAWCANLVRNPWVPQRILAAIYYQAWRLWLKRVPFYPHPRKRASVASATSH